MPRLSVRLVALAIASAAALARPASSQDSPAAPSCPAPLEVVPDAFTTDSLRLALDPGYGIKPVDETLALTALATVNDELVLPAPLAMPPVIVKWFNGGPSSADNTAVSGTQGFMAEAFVEIERSGKVKRVGLTQTSLVGSIDAALVAAVQKAADGGAFLPYQDAAHEHGGFVFVQLRTMPLPAFKEKAEDFKRPSSAALVPSQYSDEGKIRKKGGVVELPIRLLHVPLVRVTSPLVITKRGPDPLFPINERYGRQDGFVNVEFVVGTDGAVVPGTLRLANAMTTGYAKAVIRSLEKYRFKPAMAGPCPIAARETYSFTFEVL